MIGGHVLAYTTTVDGAQLPAMHPHISASDITRTPVAEYVNPAPSQVVLYVEATEADFAAFEADPTLVVLWSEPLPEMI